MGAGSGAAGGRRLRAGIALEEAVHDGLVHVYQPRAGCGVPACPPSLPPAPEAARGPPGWPWAGGGPPEAQPSGACLRFAEVWLRQCGGFPSWRCGGRGGGAGGGSLVQPGAARSELAARGRALEARKSLKVVEGASSEVGRIAVLCWGLSGLGLRARTGSGEGGRGGFPSEKPSRLTAAPGSS